ncbi:hypothetical protein BT93_E0258 [Corymbia citriodora subsp. variegata]|nr:hypothetical protein BT93_E0258 [Corymbia citriodora subsp. variegata]
MPQLHTSLHFHLTSIVIMNSSSCRDLLLNSQNFCHSIPTGAKNLSLSRLCYRRLRGSQNRRALILGWAYYLDAFSSYPPRKGLGQSSRDALEKIALGAEPGLAVCVALPPSSFLLSYRMYLGVDSKAEERCVEANLEKLL